MRIWTVASIFSFLVSSGQGMPGIAAAKERDNEHYFRIGVNAAMFTSGDMIGIGNYAEYAYALNEHLAIVPRLMGANANSLSGNTEYRALQFGASVSGRITPLPVFYRGLKFDIGALYQRFRFTDVGSSRIPGTSISIADQVTTEQEDLWGILGSLSLGVIEGKRLGAGFRLELMTSFRETAFNNEMNQVGIFMSVRL